MKKILLVGLLILGLQSFGHTALKELETEINPEIVGTTWSFVGAEILVDTPTVRMNPTTKGYVDDVAVSTTGTAYNSDRWDNIDSTATYKWYDTFNLGGTAATDYATDIEVAVATTSAVVPYTLSTTITSDIATATTSAVAPYALTSEVATATTSAVVPYLSKSSATATYYEQSNLDTKFTNVYSSVSTTYLFKAGDTMTGDLGMSDNYIVDVGSITFTDGTSMVTVGKAKVSSDDTTAGYLNAKLVAGVGIEISTENAGGNEHLKIAASAGVGAFNFYLKDKYIDEFREMTSTSSTGGVSTITVTGLSAGDTLISSFTTLSGYPGLHFLNGVGEVHTHATKTGTKVVRLYTLIYIRDILDVETLIGTSDNSFPIENATTMAHMRFALENINLTTSDRITCYIYANVSGGGADPTVEQYLEGNYDCYMSLPIPAIVEHNHLFNLSYAISGHSGFQAALATSTWKAYDSDKLDSQEGDYYAIKSAVASSTTALHAVDVVISISTAANASDITDLQTVDVEIAASTTAIVAHYDAFVSTSGDIMSGQLLIRGHANTPLVLKTILDDDVAEFSINGISFGTSLTMVNSPITAIDWANSDHDEYKLDTDGDGSSLTGITRYDDIGWSFPCSAYVPGNGWSYNTVMDTFTITDNSAGNCIRIKYTSDGVDTVGTTGFDILVDSGTGSFVSIMTSSTTLQIIDTDNCSASASDLVQTEFPIDTDIRFDCLMVGGTPGGSPIIVKIFVVYKKNE